MYHLRTVGQFPRGLPHESSVHRGTDRNNILFVRLLFSFKGCGAVWRPAGYAGRPADEPLID